MKLLLVRSNNRLFTELSNSTLNVVLSCGSGKYFTFQFRALNSAPHQNQLRIGAFFRPQDNCSCCCKRNCASQSRSLQEWPSIFRMAVYVSVMFCELLNLSRQTWTEDEP